MGKQLYLPEVPGQRYRCPCRGYRTLRERGGDDICPVCFRHDDGQDDPYADEVGVVPTAGSA